MSSHSRSTLALLGLVALGGLPFAASQTCSAEDGPVTCWTCTSGADVNIVGKLPRLNRAGKLQSANLGTYAPDLFSCPAAGSNSTAMCSLNLDTSALMNKFTTGSEASNPAALTNYIEVSQVEAKRAQK